MPNLVSHCSGSINCSVSVQSNKKSSIYETYAGGGTFNKSFYEFESLYERVKCHIPATINKPPKKKFLLGESKLSEKRRAWIEALTNHLLNNELNNRHVQEFYAPLLVDKSENQIDLGPSEKKSFKPDDFDYLSIIGKGSFGKVYRVRQKNTNKIYAMKVLGKEHIKMRKEEKHVMAERNVLKSNINHPFLVSLHFSFQTRDKLYFVLDYVNGGELFTHLQREKHFSEQRSRFYTAEIACALGYLHEKNIIYRDLKPENVLLDRMGHVVMTDFGLCKEGIKVKDTTHTFCGTPEYLAPEVIQKKSYDSTVDWWCLGSVLYEMLFGLPPFYSKNQKEMYERILHHPLQISHLASSQSRDIITVLMQKDPTKRLGAKRDFEEIKEHPFFSTIDWVKLVRREIKPCYVPKIKNDEDDSLVADEFRCLKPDLGSLITKPGATYNEPDTSFEGFTYIVPSTLEVS